MRVEQQFEVNRSLSAVWELFQDVPSIAQCLPGAELLEDHGDGTYEGSVESKLGPMSVSFEGKATVTSDSDGHSGHIDGSGSDRRGGSRGRVVMDYVLAETESGTSVAIIADLTLSGAAAQFGRTGLIKEMSGRLIAEFAECLEAKLEAGDSARASAIQASELKGFSLFFSSLFAPIIRWFRKLFRVAD